MLLIPNQYLNILLENAWAERGFITFVMSSENIQSKRGH